jgi:hypothetical protein
MSDDAMTMSRERDASRSERIEGGLGGDRYKEYDLAGYAEVVDAHVSQEMWSAVFFSWLSLKGHVQGLHEFDRSSLLCTVGKDGRVHAIFAVIWQNAETLSEWLRNGYSVERMLRSMGVPDDDIHVHLMRDFS